MKMPIHAQQVRACIGIFIFFAGLFALSSLSSPVSAAGIVTYTPGSSPTVVATRTPLDNFCLTDCTPYPTPEPCVGTPEPSLTPLTTLDLPTLGIPSETPDVPTVTPVGPTSTPGEATSTPNPLTPTALPTGFVLSFENSDNYLIADSDCVSIDASRSVCNYAKVVSIHPFITGGFIRIDFDGTYLSSVVSHNVYYYGHWNFQSGGTSSDTPQWLFYQPDSDPITGTDTYHAIDMYSLGFEPGTRYEWNLGTFTVFPGNTSVVYNVFHYICLQSAIAFCENAANPTPEPTFTPAPTDVPGDPGCPPPPSCTSDCIILDPPILYPGECYDIVPTGVIPLPVIDGLPSQIDILGISICTEYLHFDLQFLGFDASPWISIACFLILARVVYGELTS